MPTAKASLGPVGLGAAPTHAPKALRTKSDLRALQRLMTHAVVRPLNRKNDRLASHWHDGRAMSDVAAEFIKPNDRLSSVERLEIYARCYWFRIVDSLYDDCPGLRCLLGEKRFANLAHAYLTKYPSRSFTLRNLCSRLPRFIREEPRWTAPDTALAETIARFEWAQTSAFDGESLPTLTADDIVDAPPEKLKLALQPHLTLLAADWPVDDYVIAVKRREAQRAEASNAVGKKSAERLRRVRKPRRRRVHLVIHRYNGRVYYKRIPADAFLILSSLSEGRTLTRAIARAGNVTPDEIREWFALWTELGWLTKRGDL